MEKARFPLAVQKYNNWRQALQDILKVLNFGSDITRAETHRFVTLLYLPLQILVESNIQTVLLSATMSYLFENHQEVSQAKCEDYAQNLVGSPVVPLSWQGYFSYTVLSKSGQIVQFRARDSPLNITLSTLAKQIHGPLAPATTYHGLLPDSTVTVWIMEALPGTGYASIYSYIDTVKLDAAVSDLAK